MSLGDDTFGAVPDDQNDYQFRSKSARSGPFGDNFMRPQVGNYDDPTTYRDRGDHEVDCRNRRNPPYNGMLGGGRREPRPESFARPPVGGFVSTEHQWKDWRQLPAADEPDDVSPPLTPPSSPLRSPLGQAPIVLHSDYTDLPCQFCEDMMPANILEQHQVSSPSSMAVRQ